MPGVVKQAASLEYIEVAVTPLDTSGEEEDVSGDTVTLAFVELGGTVDDDTTFYPANWVTVNGVQTARTIVGPGQSFEPAPLSAYDVYVKIVDNPEIPVLYAYRAYFK
jgi:hypothetical protein